MGAEISTADRERGSRVLYVLMLLIQMKNDEHISLGEFGHLTAAEQSKLGEGKVDAFSASTVSRWQSGESEPDGITFRAMSRLVKGKVGPGWIHYGPESANGPKELDLTLMGQLASARAAGRRGSRG